MRSKSVQWLKVDVYNIKLDQVFDLLPVTEPVQKVISTLVMKFRVFMCRFLNDKGVMCLFAKP